MSEKVMQQSAEAPQFNSTLSDRLSAAARPQQLLALYAEALRFDSAHPDNLPASASPQQLLALYAEALRFDSAHPGTCRPPDNLPAPASPQQLLALFAETMARDTATTGQSFPPPWSDEHFAILWGPNWPGHPFRQPPLLWHKDLREPDVTKLICSLCCDDSSGERWQRRKAFLRALWAVHALRVGQEDWRSGDAIHAKLPQLPSDDRIYKRMRCTAEHPVRLNKSDSADTTTEEIVSSNEGPVSSNNSTGTGTEKTLWLDIFFSADKDKDGNEFHYAVEVKFGALVDNDLEAYNSFVCKEYESDPPTYCLSILGSDRKQISNEIDKKRQYPIAEWHQFLKVWEKYLQEESDSDPQFAQLRNSIWRKI